MYQKQIKSSTFIWKKNYESQTFLKTKLKSKRKNKTNIYFNIIITFNYKILTFHVVLKLLNRTNLFFLAFL